jgi:hypothetical protein
MPRGLAQDLAQLALENSSDKRLKLLRRLTDVYLESDEEAVPAAQYLFDELVERILGGINANDRADASVQFSTMNRIPDSLAHRLATDDDIRVAAPMVQNYEALSENTLLAVAQKGSQEHLQSIVRRAVISPSVSDIVVERGDQNTVRKLAAHRGAQFSSGGMRKLALKSEADAELQSLLVDRADLSLEAIGVLLPRVSEELATRLRNRSIATDQAVLDSQVTGWMQERSKNIARTDAYIRGIREGHLRLEDVVKETLRSKRLLDVVTVFAGVMNLDTAHAFALFAKGTSETTLLLLRSIGLPWPLVEGFLELKKEKLEGQPDEDVVQAVYESIDIAAAQRVVRFMKVRRVASAPAVA